jgi:Asp-tRNA(Asn)/Glu-tRNA(Gln) amidotransferase A subunit family amidase
LFSKVVFNSNAADLDERALGVPWIEPEEKKILTIGVMPEDALYPLHPQMQRALEMCSQKLEAVGHKLVYLSSVGMFPSVSEASDLSSRFFNMDPDHTLVSHIKRSGEALIPSLKSTFDHAGHKPEMHLRELYEMNVAQRKIAAHMHQVFMNNQLDLIIGPGYQSCAVPHDTYGIPPYTVLWNLLNVS